MTYYDEKLKYIMDDMLIESPKFNYIKSILSEIMIERQKLQEFNLKIKLTFTGLNSETPIVRKFYRENILKSHEVKTVCTKINNKIGSLLEKKSSSLQESLSKFKRFHKYLAIIYKKYPYRNPPEFKIYIKLFELKKFNSKIVFAIVSEFNLKPMGYCEKINFTISKMLKDGSNPVIIHDVDILKERISEIDGILTMKDKDEVFEFYSHPDVKKILFQYIFPEGKSSNLKTEITFSQLRYNTQPQKRRQIELRNGQYQNLHDILSPYTTLQEFREIVKRNHICTFYTSVRELSPRKVGRRMITALIDLDMSNFLRNLLDKNTVWKFTTSVVKEITKNLIYFGFPKPLILFSGKRGIHLLYWLSQDALDDSYNYIDLSEMHSLPGQKSLVKNVKSLIHSRFSFMKNFFEAILLYTILNIEPTVIPEKLSKILAPIKQSDLFKLSVHSSNDVALLLDTSSNNSSVHKVFSFHRSSGLISIPLSDPFTGDIAEEYELYENVLNAANPEVVLENLNQGNKISYFQKPPQISRLTIQNSLLPQKGLLQVFYYLMRFGSKWIMERSKGSDYFWGRFYQLRSSYNHLYSNLLCGDKIQKSIKKQKK